MAEPYFLPPDKIRIEQQDNGLVLVMDGQRTVVGPPRRALPLSEPDTYIVFSDVDGNEVGILSQVAALEPVSQQILRESLAAAYVITRITRILEVDREPLSGQTRWRVEIEQPDDLSISLTLQDAASIEGISQTGNNGHTSNGQPSGDSSTDSDDAAEGDDTTDQPGRLQRVGRLLRLSRDPEKFDDSQQAEEREFFINGQEDVQTARYPHIFIVDTDRNRYEIIDCEALDTDSRKAAERFF